MKSPSRRLRRVLGGATAGLLGLSLVPILAEAASASSPALGPGSVVALDQTVIHNGANGNAAPGGTVEIGSSSTTFAVGEQIILQVAQPGVGTPTVGNPASAPNCSDAAGANPEPAGSRRFVAYNAATPPSVSSTAAGAATATVQLQASNSSGGTNGVVPGFCTNQPDGVKFDIAVLTIQTGGTGPLDVAITYDVGAGTTPATTSALVRAASAQVGPVRIFVGGTPSAVPTPFALGSANDTATDSNAWVTSLDVNVPVLGTVVTNPNSGTVTFGASNPIVISEFLADATGTQAGTATSTVCLDLVNAVWDGSSAPVPVSTGFTQDQVTRIDRGTGPFAGAGSREQITIIPGVVVGGSPSTITITGLKVTVNVGTTGNVRVVLTDCGDDPTTAPPDTQGPLGSLIGQLTGGPRTNLSSIVNTATTIGNFSGPNPGDPNLRNRTVILRQILVDRSGGNDRVATARILQQEKYGLSGVNLDVTQNGVCSGLAENEEDDFCGGTRFALVATADNFPDALAASYAAGRIGAAILLVRPTTDALAQLQLALSNLGVKVVFILGGESAVPKSVFDFVSGLNTSCTKDSQCGGGLNVFVNGDPRVDPGTKLTVARIADPGNPDRFGTMRLLNILTSLPISVPGVVTQQVQNAFNSSGGATGLAPARTAFLVSAANFPDALAAGVQSYARGIPMVLTDPAALSPLAKQTLQDLQTQQVIIVGGTNAVSQAVQDTVAGTIASGGQNLVVTRVAGSNRQLTAVALNTFMVNTEGATIRTILLARGDAFPDALTAAVQGVGPLRGVISINGGIGLGADINKLNYAGQASLFLTVSPTVLGPDTQAGLVNLQGIVTALKCLGLQQALDDRICSPIVGVNTITITIPAAGSAVLALLGIVLPNA